MSTFLTFFLICYALAHIYCAFESAKQKFTALVVFNILCVIALIYFIITQW